jgi:hypothetical protein
MEEKVIRYVKQSGFYSMKKLSFSSNGKERHLCKGMRRGEWVVYACSECDYEFWQHWNSGETKMVNIKQGVDHSGLYLSPLYEQTIQRMN